MYIRLISKPFNILEAAAAAAAKPLSNCKKDQQNDADIAPILTSTNLSADTPTTIIVTPVVMTLQKSTLIQTVNGRVLSIMIQLQL